ncbi:hypothetical protein LPJ79_003524 [Coemansia sp. RSA 1821]|nr:hypothetical protein LPJ79_003524 [Coemansia sp. RSA 1821]
MTNSGPAGDITEMTERHAGRVEPAGKPPTARNAMILGIAALGVCILSFVGQTTATRQVQETYQHPYLILWVSHSFWVIMLPLHTIYEKLKRRSRSLAELRAEVLLASASLIVQRSQTSREYQPVQPADPDDAPRRASGVEAIGDGARVRTTFKDDESDEEAETETEAEAEAETDNGARRLAERHPWLVLWRVTALAALLVGLLNASAYLWYVAVGLSSMSKVTAIYNTSCFFAYLFSVLLLGDRVQVAKCAAVAVSIIGVVFMALVNSRSDDGANMTAEARNTELLGDALSLVCACGIGLYQVLYKKYAVPRDFHSLYTVNFITAMLGLCTLVLCWVPVPLFHFTGIERFAWPTREQALMILANALAGVAYNGGFMIALTLTSPLFAAIGVMLTIPAMAVIDMLIQGSVLPWNVFVGGGAILAGFCVLTLAEYPLSVVDTVSNWWHAVVCISLSLLPKARTTYPVCRPTADHHPAVLVTGTSSGIGHDTAIALAAYGYTVFAGVRTWEDGARVEAAFLDSVEPDKVARNPWVRRASRASRHTQRHVFSAGSAMPESSSTDNSDSGNMSQSAVHPRRRRQQLKQQQRQSSPRANKTFSGAVVPVILDVASAESVNQAYERISKELRRRRIPLAAVVNNAGVTACGPMDTSDMSFIDSCMAVNFRGPVRVTQRFMPLLRASRGRIVNISSVMSWLIGPGFGVYCASKAALTAASRAWHYELASSGISISVLEPGITRTALWSKLESQLELHHARLNGKHPTRAKLNGNAAAPAALPGDESVAAASPGRSDDDSSTERALYSPMMRRIKTSNELAPIFALPTRHTVGAVVHALTSRYPKSTYRIGWDARLLSLATWIASEEVVEWLCRVIGIVSES